MANNSKQCFNTHYQPHCHPTSKSLWLCSSVYCRPPHQSRRIWLVATATNQKICGSAGIFHNIFNIGLYNVNQWYITEATIWQCSENWNRSCLIEYWISWVYAIDIKVSDANYFYCLCWLLYYFRWCESHDILIYVIINNLVPSCFETWV